MWAVQQGGLRELLLFTGRPLLPLSRPHHSLPHHLLFQTKLLLAWPLPLRFPLLPRLSPQPLLASF